MTGVQGGNLGPAASSRPPPETALARFGLLGLCLRPLCAVLAILYGSCILVCDTMIMIMGVCRCQFVCPSVCSWKTRAGKVPDPFPSGVYSLFRFSCGC